MDTKDWLPGRKVRIKPDRVASIQIEDRLLTVDATREQIEGLPEVAT